MKIIRLKHLKTILIILLFFIILYLFDFFDNKKEPLPGYKSKCNLERATYVLQELCDNYLEQKVAIGSMCASICNPRNKLKKFEVYKLVGCYNYNEDQDQMKIGYEFKTVMVYEVIHKRYINKDTPERLVFKSAHKSIYDFDSRIESDFETKSIVEQLKFLSALIRQTLSSSYGIQVDQSLMNWMKKYIRRESVSTGLNKDKDIFYYVNLLSTKNYENFENVLRKSDKRNLANFIKNLDLLISQDEYLFSKYFQKKDHTLDVYGTCGHFYAIEHAESLGSQVKSMDVTKRKKLGLQFLDLVKNFDLNYLPNYVKKTYQTEASDIVVEGFEQSEINGEPIPLQICDVKLENFGLTSNGDLKVIDLDMIHPNSYLFHPKYCEKHDDCHFFDCKTYCDLTQKKCNLDRINDNLQSICEKIFDNTFIEEDALLSHLNTDDSVSINLLVRKCAEPSFFNNSNIPLKAGSSKMFNELSAVLKN